jgi:hypothetical protein
VVRSAFKAAEGKGLKVSFVDRSEAGTTAGGRASRAPGPLSDQLTLFGRARAVAPAVGKLAPLS